MNRKGEKKMKKTIFLFLISFSFLFFYFSNVKETEKKLYKTLIKHDYIEAKELIKNGANINSRFKNNLTLLMIASRKGDLSLVNFLLNNGADINKKANKHITALNLSVKFNHREVVKKLIHFGARINDNRVFYSTALLVAVESENFKTTKLLVKNGAKVSFSSHSGDYKIHNYLVGKNAFISPPCYHRSIFECIPPEIDIFTFCKEEILLKKALGLDFSRDFIELKQDEKPRILMKIEIFYKGKIRKINFKKYMIVEIYLNIYGRVLNVEIIKGDSKFFKSIVKDIEKRIYEPSIIKGIPKRVRFIETIELKISNIKRKNKGVKSTESSGSGLSF